MLRSGVWLLILAVGMGGLFSPAFSGPSSYDQQIKKKNSDLRQLKKTLKKKKSEQDEARRKEKDLKDEVAQISRELKSSQRSLKKVESQIRAAEKELKKVEQRLWSSNLGIHQWENILSEELASYYQEERVFGRSRPRKMAYRRAAIMDKTRSLDFAQEQHSRVEEHRDELVELQVKLQKLRLNKAAEKKKVQLAKSRMQKLYKTVQGRRAILEKEIGDLRASAKSLEKFIDKLIKEQIKAEKLAAAKTKKKRLSKQARLQKGRFSWPLEGKIIERFGKTRHAELDTYVFSNGIKLRPAARASVRTIEKGTVAYTGEFMSYGLMTLISHPDDVHSIYAHLGRIDVKKGQPLSAGEVLGAAGQDDGGRPLIYFELRVDGTAVDPLEWLK